MLAWHTVLAAKRMFQVGLLVSALLFASSWLGDDRYWPVMLVHRMPLPLFGLAVGVASAIALVCRRRNLAALGAGSAALLALAVPPSLHLPRSPAPASLRVVTYNLQHGIRGLAPLAQSIEKVDADVLCFQEATPVAEGASPYGELEPVLREYHLVRAKDLAIASRFPVLGHRSISLDDEGMKVALCATLDVHGTRVTVASVHLTPTSLDQVLFRAPLESAERLRRVAALHARQVGSLLAIANDVDTPLIIAGDFNAQPTSSALRTLATHLRDSFAAVGMGYGNTLPSGFPIFRYDYVFTRGFTIEGCRVLPGTASDHRAVEAWLSLPR